MFVQGRFWVHTDSVFVVTGPSDAEAIVGSLENPDRFDEIYRRYRDDIFRFVARRIGPDDAPDITADVFVRAFRVRDRYDPSRPDARPWLYGIATNVVGDHRRRMRIRRSRTESIAVSWLERDAEFSDLVAADADAVSQRAQLVTALRSLRRRDREVLLLAVLEDLTYQQIAEALGMPVGTVRSSLNRARRRMRELISEAERTTGVDTPEEPL